MDRTDTPDFELKLQRAGAAAAEIVAVEKSGEVFELEEQLRRLVVDLARTPLVSAREALPSQIVCLEIERALAERRAIPLRWRDEAAALRRLADDIAARLPDREGLVFGASRYTFAEVAARIDEAARRLIAAGVGHGEHVALWLNNCDDWIFIAFAVQKIGAVLVPINTRFVRATSPMSWRNPTAPS